MHSNQTKPRRLRGRRHLALIAFAVLAATPLTALAERSPQIAGDEAQQRGLHLDGRLDLDADWSADGSLDTFGAGYRAGGRLMKDVGEGLSIGPELILERGVDGSAQQMGLVLQSRAPVSGLNSALKLGAERDEDGRAGAFLGIEFSRRF